MRAFIAIDIPNSIKESIYEVSKNLSTAGIVVVKPEAMHITLQFLGEIDDTTEGRVEEALGSIEYKSFGISLHGIGYFSPGFIRVLFVEVKEGREELNELYSMISSALKLRSIRFDSTEYTPHLTIARVKYVKDKHMLTEFAEKYAAHDFGSFRPEAVKLKKSVLGSGGPVYSDVYSKSLTPLPQ